MTDWLQQYLDAWNMHNPAAVAAFMAEDATYEDLALGVKHEGREAIKAFVAEAEQFSSDHKFIAVSEQVSGDRYALEWEMVGTNTGEGGGLPATNKHFHIRGVSIGRLASDGTIKENRDYWNMVDYLTQVGLMPTPGA
jgi:steroid delta-isomerase-like uncharacterized protein